LVEKGIFFVTTSRPGHEADHSLPSSAEDNNMWSYISTPPIHVSLVSGYFWIVTL